MTSGAGTSQTETAQVLSGRVALITGAGQGVGRGIALAMAAAGAKVVLAGRTVSKCETVAAEVVERGGEALAVQCDVKSRTDIEACVQQTADTFGAIDILVNNAQQVVRGPLLEVSDDDMAVSWESGPLASLRFMQLCHPYLAASEADGGGVVMNLGSRSGVKSDPIHCGPYASVKESIRVLTRTAAWEWADDGIRTFALLPLATSPALIDFEADDPEAYARVISDIPMARFGDPETDIGKVAVFLASDDARYLTGMTVPIDGGAAHPG